MCEDEPQGRSSGVSRERPPARVLGRDAVNVVGDALLVGPLIGLRLVVGTCLRLLLLLGHGGTSHEKAGQHEGQDVQHARVTIGLEVVEERFVAQLRGPVLVGNVAPQLPRECAEGVGAGALSRAALQPALVDQ